MSANLKLFRKKFTPLLMAFLFLGAQVTSTLALTIINTPTAEAAPICLVDTAGANDEPGQKDLTLMCVDYAGVPTTVATTWNWDDLGTNGANTLDACNLFDTDGDGNINYAVCVTTTGTPAVLQSTTTYSCGDTKPDRCTSTASVIPNGTTTCTVSQQNTNPFSSGTADTEGKCTIQLSTVGGASAKLIDVCSYPSAQPNSDPSDCVIAQDNSGKLEVIKNLQPTDNSGLFNLQVDSVTKAANVGHNGTTGELVYDAGNHTVGETAGTNTSLAGYSTTIVCRDLNGTGAIVAQATSTSVSVPLTDDADVICTITNTAAGSISIVKNAIPNSLQDFSFTSTGTGTSNFVLDDDSGVAGSDATNSNTKTFNNLGAGTYTFTESAVNGWYLDDIECPNITENKNLETRQLSLTISAGQNITCTFTNRQLGQIKVTKQTDPNDDPTQFAISANPSAGVVGSANQNISDNQTVTYTVKHGTYSVSETVPDGWAETSNNCSNLVIDGNTPLVNGVPTLSCTITNTKKATLTIVKDALPNHSTDFSFVTETLPGGNFSLDDDAGAEGESATLSNQKVFSNLTPNTAYSVSENAVTGWELTGLSCDTGNYSAVASMLSVTPTAGQNITCTFTNTKYGSISGLKYEVNSDGSSVGTISGWTITLLLGGNVYGTTLTDANGMYSFLDLLPGDYELQEENQTGYTQVYPLPNSILVGIEAGETSENNNFGNFENGLISGYKWNDIDANGQKGENEPKLSGWTINLYDEENSLSETTDTDVNGNYSFTDLAPGTYSVCETLKSGWVQTYPNPNCHIIVINQSGETNSDTNFGNQGRANLTVKKNVDSDGDGVVDQTNVASWVYDINGSGDYATGSTQNVPAGTHTISEEQQENYTFVSVSCDTEKQVTQSESFEITVNPGDNITCTFINARDTGTITVNKILNPSSDAGIFDLQIDGQLEGTGNDVGNGGTTGAITVPTGMHSVSEIAAGLTDLSNYSTTYECDNEVSGDGTTSSSFNVEKGEDVVCTFTNVRYAQIIVQKQTLPDGSETNFNFTANYDQDGFVLRDGQSNNSGNLLPGTYSVSETIPFGWDLTSASCSDQSPVSAIQLSAGEIVTCTFTNTQRGSIYGTKYEVNSDDTSGTEGNELMGWLIELYYDSPQDEDTFLDDLYANEETDSDGNYSFDNLQPGEYKVCEVLQTGYTQIFPNANSGCYLVTLQPGQSVVDKDFGNFQNASITGYKFNDLNGNGVHDESEPKLSGWEISLYKDQIIQDTATTTAEGNFSFNDLAPGIYVVCETQQDGWQQTTPDPEADACYEIEINESGEEASAVFGNQGRGSVTIYKNVDVNGDGDLDDQEDIKGATDWQWSLDGTYYTDSGIATGETKSNIPADTYTISETQKDNYHFVSVKCYINRTGEEVTQSESFQITVAPGDNVTCTFTNARDTGFIIVEKELEPANDQGVFDLNVNEVEVYADAGDGDSSDPHRVPTGSHTVSEEAGNDGVDLASYVTTYVCIDDQGQGITMGEGSTISDVSVGDNQTVTCTFTNTKRPSITIVKDALPNHEQDFEFETDLQEGTLTLDDDGDEKNEYKRSQTFLNLTPGESYYATEGDVKGWQLTNLNCEGTENWSSEGSSIYVEPSAGEDVVCTFENTKLAKITVIKDAIPDDSQDFNFNVEEYKECEYELLDIENGNCYLPLDHFSYDFSLDDDEDETLSNTKKVKNLLPGSYKVSEELIEGWDLVDIYCDYGQNGEYGEGYVHEYNSQIVELYPGSEVTCTFINVKRAKITIVKDAQPDSPQEFTFEHNIGDGSQNGTSSVDSIQVQEYEESDEFTLVDDGVNPALKQKDFENIRVYPRGSYFGISEKEVDGWRLDDFSCDNEDDEQYEEGPFISALDYEKYYDHYFKVRPGEHVTCTFVNQELALNITKTNNKPDPTVTGDTVLYTLKVTVPDQASELYDSKVIDLPPENFQYVNGSWTANSSVRGDIKADNTTTEPTYASPGTWNLGDLVGGEVITLTYQATILSNVTPGIYPDIAFVNAFGPEEQEVLGNVKTADSPFVGTAVAVAIPPSTEFVAPTLVNTGRMLNVAFLVVPLVMVSLTVFAYRRSRPSSEKGGQL